MDDLHKHPVKSKLPRLMASTASIVCVVALLSWFMFYETRIDSEVTSAAVPADRSNSAVDAAEENITGKTVGTEWQWDRLPVEKEQGESESQELTAMFDVPFIYESLQDVRVDESGNVVIDNKALQALDATLNFSGIEMNAAQLQELQALIRIGLPGAAGEQTAAIVGDYYEFLQAEKEFNNLYKTAGTQMDVEAGFEELVALRELYLGPEVAAKLFAEHDRNARYMLESMLLERDESLSAEEKLARQERLSASFHSKMPKVHRWEQRYAIFQQAQAAITESAISEEEKQRQLAQLMEQHFSAEELPAVRVFLEEQ